MLPMCVYFESLRPGFNGRKTDPFHKKKVLDGRPFSSEWSEGVFQKCTDVRTGKSRPKSPKIEFRGTKHPWMFKHRRTVVKFQKTRIKFDNFWCFDLTFTRKSIIFACLSSISWAGENESKAPEIVRFYGSLSKLYRLFKIIETRF